MAFRHHRIHSSSSSAGFAGQDRSSCVAICPYDPQAFRGGFVDIEQAGEHQKGNLLDDGEWIGNAAGPEFCPRLIDVVLELVGNHNRILMG